MRVDDRGHRLACHHRSPPVALAIIAHIFARLPVTH
jgi:hypothetical protein